MCDWPALSIDISFPQAKEAAEEPVKKKVKSNTSENKKEKKKEAAPDGPSRNENNEPYWEVPLFSFTLESL